MGYGWHHLHDKMANRELEDEPDRGFDYCLPREESTIILDFDRYYNEPPPSTKVSPYKKSLIEEYNDLKIYGNKKKTLLDHLKYTIYDTKSMDDSHTIFISQPSFIRDSYKITTGGDVFIKNIAIRIPFSKKQDFVIVGDIKIFNQKNGSSGKKYVVKHMLMINSGETHNGEIELRAKIITAISDRGEHAFLSIDGSIYSGRPNYDIVANSKFDEKFLAELNNKYIVLDPISVQNKINEWHEFLETKLSEANDTSNGFTIKKPEFITCYSGPKIEIADSNQIIDENETKIWTYESNLPGFKPALIARIRHEVKQKIFNSDKNYIKKFNSVTSDGVTIIDPTKKLLEDATNLEKKDEKNPLRRLGDNRISPVKLSELKPKSQIEELQNTLDKQISVLKSSIFENTTSDVEHYITDFIETDAYKLQINLKIAKRTEEIQKKIDDEISNKIDEILSDKDEELDIAFSQLKKLDSNSNEYQELKLKCEQIKKQCIRSEISKEINRDEISKLIINDIEKEISSEIISEKRKEIWDDIFNKNTEDIDLKIDSAEKKTLEQIKKIEDDNVTKILTVHFAIDVSPENIKNEAESRTALFEKENGFKLVYDNAGETTVLKRQLNALDCFSIGELTNPYLAASIFSQDMTIQTMPPELGFYYAKNLNETQRNAVKGAMATSGIYLIQGPPGTGKTQVISEITAQEVMRGKKVLISSQNHKAVDNAFGRLYKSPIIRPVRIISDEKINSYDLNHVVSNFYKNICESLRNTIIKMSNEEYRSTASQKVKALEEEYEKLTEFKNKNQDIQDQIEYYVKIINKNQSLLNEKNNERINNEIEKTNIVLMIDGLERFEESSLMIHSGEIYALFNPHSARLVNKKKIFGQNGYACILSKMSVDEIKNNLILTNKHPNYTVMMVQYLHADENGRRRIEDYLSGYLESNGLAEDDFILFNMFEGKIPDNLVEIRESLIKIKTKAEMDLRFRLDKLENYIDPQVEEIEYKIEYAKETLNSLKNDDNYLEAIDRDIQLNQEIQDLCDYLRITKAFDTQQEALKILNDEISNIDNFTDSDIEKSIETYRDIIDYLEDDETSSIDNERLTKHLCEFANVIGMTCTSKGMTERQSVSGREEDTISVDINKLGIDTVIIDEVSKVPFSEMLQPMLSAKTVIMVGDHNQLPPVYTDDVSNDPNASKDDVEKEKRYHQMYTEPLFEDLFNKSSDDCKIMLKTQYRMAKQIMDADNIFYDGELIMGCDNFTKNHHLSINGKTGKLIDESNSILFVDCNGKEFQESGSTSWTNMLEAKVAAELIRLIEHNCKTNSYGDPLAKSSPISRLSAGIITPYAAQSKLIKSMLDEDFTAFRTDDDEKFMVKSVDDFQGDERDIIILSLVRTNENSKFIKDFRRINVAMSRARRLLIILGKASVLENMNVELTRSDGSKYVKKAYGEIIKSIKNTDGYHLANEIIGGCDVNE